MSLKTEEQLLAELDAAVHPGGPLGKTTAPGLRAFLASLVADVVAARAATPGTGTPGDDVPGADGSPDPHVLTSLHGLTYRLTVADDGTLGTAPADGLPLPDAQQLLTSLHGLAYRLGVTDEGALYTLPATGEVDPEAVAFIAAAGLRSAAHQLAVAALVRTLKESNVWPQLRAVYPMVGGTARAHALNLVDPRPVPEAFALQFYHDPAHTDRGVEWNGADQYADTGFVPATALSPGAGHLAYYATTAGTGTTTQVELGSHDGRVSYSLLLRHSNGTPYSYLDGAGTTLRSPSPVPSGRGLALGSFEAQGTATFYRDGQALASTPPNPGWAHTTAPVLLGRRQEGYASQKACGFASLGAGLTPAQAAAYSAAIRDFQQALGREAAFDADAAAFVAAAGLSAPPAVQAVDDLVRALKASGVWERLRAVYPLVGGTEQAHRLNLKDPRDADSAFRLDFANAPQHTARGVEWSPAAHTYATTHLVPRQHLPPADHHLAYYAVTDSSPAAVVVDIGAAGNGSLTLLLRHPDVGRGAFFESAGATRVSQPLGHGLGFGLAVRTSPDAVALYRDGQALPLADTAYGNYNGNHPDVPVWLGGRQDGLFSDKVCGFASVGLGLTPAQATAYAAAVLAFQQALGRASSPSPAVLLG